MDNEIESWNSYSTIWVNRIYYKIIKHGDDNVILESKILVEIHIEQITCNISYPRVEDNANQ